MGELVIYPLKPPFSTSEGAVDDRDVTVCGNVVVVVTVLTLIHPPSLESVVTGRAPNSGAEEYCGKYIHNLYRIDCE